MLGDLGDMHGSGLQVRVIIAILMNANIFNLIYRRRDRGSFHTGNKFIATKQSPVKRKQKVKKIMLKRDSKP